MKRIDWPATAAHVRGERAERAPLPLVRRPSGSAPADERSEESNKTLAVDHAVTVQVGPWTDRNLRPPRRDRSPCRVHRSEDHRIRTPACEFRADLHRHRGLEPIIRGDMRPFAHVPSDGKGYPRCSRDGASQVPESMPHHDLSPSPEDCARERWIRSDVSVEYVRAACVRTRSGCHDPRNPPTLRCGCRRTVRSTTLVGTLRPERPAPIGCAIVHRRPGAVNGNPRAPPDAFDPNRMVGNRSGSRRRGAVVHRRPHGPVRMVCTADHAIGLMLMVHPCGAGCRCEAGAACCAGWLRIDAGALPGGRRRSDWSHESDRRCHLAHPERAPSGFRVARAFFPCGDGHLRGMIPVEHPPAHRDLQRGTVPHDDEKGRRVFCALGWRSVLPLPQRGKGRRAPPGHVRKPPHILRGVRCRG